MTSLSVAFRDHNIVLLTTGFVHDLLRAVLRTTVFSSEPSICDQRIEISGISMRTATSRLIDILSDKIYLRSHDIPLRFAYHIIL